MTAPRVVCVIPAFEAAATVGAVVEALRAERAARDVIVVDDGSRDGTHEAARLGGARVVLRHDTNRGKGAALRTGIAAALARGADVVVTLDADGQHPPALVAALVAATADAHVVVGVRRRGGTAMPPQRRLSNWLSSAVVSTLAGQHVADSQSGFRAIRREVVESVRLVGDRYDLETDFLVRAARAGFRVASVPVPTVYEGGRSHFRPVRDTALLVRTMVRLGFASTH